MSFRKVSKWELFIMLSRLSGYQTPDDKGHLKNEKASSEV